MSRAGMTVHLVRGRAARVPPGVGWLSSRERMAESGLRFPKRRSDWRLGRWVAKRAVLDCLAADGMEIAPSIIEILADSSGAPRGCVLSPCDARSVSLSISHSHGVGLAAAALGAVGLGCDVERIESHTERFVADHFTAAERERVARAEPNERAAVVTLLWSAKEAALKVLGEGMRLDTRAVGVHLSPGAPAAWGDPGTALSVGGPGASILGGWGWVESGFVWTVVGDRNSTLVFG